MESKTKLYQDNRGFFIPYNLDGWDQMNISTNTNCYTFRGLHYQTSPYQTKLVNVIQGEVLDILYNLKTGEVETYELDRYNQLLIKPNYAHGFLTLQPNTIFTYLVSGEYNPKSEHSIVWDSVPKVKEIIQDIIGNNKLTISKKDKEGK